MKIMEFENMNGLKRTHYSGVLREENIGEDVVVTGFVANHRELSGLTFIVLRDRTGLLQLSFSQEKNAELFEKANTLRHEYVVLAKGKVIERSSKNSDMATGAIEIEVDELRILSEAKTPPFEIRDEINVNEELRLKHRYLDLRRTPLQNNLQIRHRMLKSARDFYDEQGFIEVETPAFSRSTPEGARDYLVPSRVHPGKFFSLPQSPQLFKQMLMIAGFDKYVQVAKCFRDEDLRADRQPEFTQLDVEMSYIDEEDIMDLTENMLRRVFKETINHEIPAGKFRQIPHAEALARFGSDKPDTRFGLELVSLSEELKNSEFRVFSGSLQDEKGYVGAVNAKGLAEKISRKNIDRLTKELQGMGAKGLAYLRLLEDSETSSYEKFISDEEIKAIREKTDAKPGDVIFIVGDSDGNLARNLLGTLRTTLAKSHELYDKNTFDLLWIVDFPAFEYDEEDKRFVAVHHPFTAPKDEHADLLLSAPEKVSARAYDIVINGYEVGGGSIRISNPNMQEKMFEALGMSKEDAEERFGFFLEALKYGVPPHGGIAFGADRLAMILAGTDNIKDVIAFPKLQNSSDPMSECPAPAAALQLEELGILIDPQVLKNGEDD